MQSRLSFSWDGWSDDMSVVHGFSIQEFLLKPDGNVQPNLTEPDRPMACQKHVPTRRGR